MRILGTSWSDCDSSAAALNGYWWEATLGSEPTKGSTKCCCELDGWWHMSVLKQKKNGSGLELPRQNQTP